MSACGVKGIIFLSSDCCNQIITPSLISCLIIRVQELITEDELQVMFCNLVIVVDNLDIAIPICILIDLSFVAMSMLFPRKEIKSEGGGEENQMNKIGNSHLLLEFIIYSSKRLFRSYFNFVSYTCYVDIFSSF